MGEPPPSNRRAAFVTSAGQRRPLDPDTVVTFGRHEDCDVRIGADDSWVSRHVGLVRMDAAGAVTVELTSSRHVVRVITPSQSERVLEPRPEGASQEQLRLVWEHATVIVPGEGNAAYRVFVVTGEPTADDAPSAPPDLPELTVTVESRLSDDERLLLTALSEPVLRFGPVAEPASYAMVGERLEGRLTGRSGAALTARMARRYLDDLLERLTTVERVPGLVGDEVDEDSDDAELAAPGVRRLALWAVMYGVVTVDDLELLP